jgi:hypothetical protein
MFFVVSVLHPHPQPFSQREKGVENNRGRALIAGR